ncbi:MAG: MFS transporter [Acidimicrobiia bacterium]|nr:MFS transporter [Acidimicrobiia bacterium]
MALGVRLGTGVVVGGSRSGTPLARDEALRMAPCGPVGHAGSQVATTTLGNSDGGGVLRKHVVVTGLVLSEPATPAVIGLVIGGRVADRSGRRRLAVICAPTGALLIALSFSFSGPLMWWSAIFGAIIAATSYPPLAVYRTELFPTGNRGRASYLILASALVGGPVVVALIVAVTYPETARRELEELNPEDHTLPIERDDSVE